MFNDWASAASVRPRDGFRRSNPGYTFRKGQKLRMGIQGVQCKPALGAVFADEPRHPGLKKRLSEKIARNDPCSFSLLQRGAALGMVFVSQPRCMLTQRNQKHV